MTRSVVLLVLDSVRKDVFDRHATNIQQLSDISFDRCYAPSSWSAPSHASMLIGTLPSEHGIHAHNIDLSGIDPEDTFLPEVSANSRVGVSSNIFAGTPYGFDEYFDDFTSVSRHSVFADGLSIDEFINETESNGLRRYVEFLQTAFDQGVFVKSFANGISLKLDEVTRNLPVPRFYDYGTKLILQHVEQALDDEVSFAFANLMEAHAPLRVSTKYDWDIQGYPVSWHSDQKDLWEVNNADDLGPYQDYLETYRDVYAAAIEYIDRSVKELIERVLSERDDVTFVITADHGENLGYESDGGILGHVGALGDSLLHVPLAVVNPPKSTETDKDDLISLLDLPKIIESIVRDNPITVSRTYAPAERVGLGLDTDPENVEYWDRMIRRVIREDGTTIEWDSLGNAERDHGEGPKPIAPNDVPSWAKAQFNSPILEYKQQAVRSSTERDVDEATESRLADLGYL